MIIAAGSFEGKVALVTGGGSGMGRSISLGYGRHGGSVGVVDFNGATAEAAAEEIKASGGRALAVQADVRSRSDVESAVQTVVRHFGRIDLVVNNAFASLPGYQPCLTEELSDEHWRQVMSVLVDAAFFSARAVLPIMRAQGSGVILNVASIAGLAASPGGIAYSTAKAAMINFSRVIAVEYGRFGIRCNAICPGFIETPLSAGIDAVPSMKQAFLDSIPIGRTASPNEVANLALFLASDLASFITGAVYAIDGGQTAQINMPSALPMHYQPRQ